jgi:hypothetical protein
MFAIPVSRRIIVAAGVIILSTIWFWSFLAARPLPAEASSPGQRAPLAPRWHVVSSPTPGSEAFLYGVTELSANNSWAVGFYINSSGQSRTLTEHWNGTQWKVVSSPSVPNTANYLFSVAALSANNVWAVGNTGSINGTQTLIEHWNGSSWQVVPSPNPGQYNYLYGVTAVSASNIWAVGRLDTGGLVGTLIEHWNGSSWQVFKSPNASNYNELYSMARVSANNIWAVGIYDIIRPDGIAIAQTLTEHWNGSSWQIVSSPNVGTGKNNFLAGVTAISASNVWAVGWTSDPATGKGRPLIERWNGTAWKVVSSPAPTAGGGLNGVAAVSASNIWAVGSYTDLSIGKTLTLIEHWNGTSWQIVSSGNPGSYNILHAVATISTGQAVVAGEYTVNFGPGRTLVETYP